MRNLNLWIALYLLLPMITLANKSQHHRKHDGIRKVRLSELPHNEAIRYHKMLSTLAIKIEKKYKFPKTNNNSFSINNILRNVSEVIFPFCHAGENGDDCLFGGYVSVYSGGSCIHPWKQPARVRSDELGSRIYDEDSFCDGTKLFRCNPIVYGPGLPIGISGDRGVQKKVEEFKKEFPTINGNINQDHKNGFCVKVDKWNNTTEKCGEMSARLEEFRKDAGIKKWRDTSFLNSTKLDEFFAIQKHIADFCDALDYNDEDDMDSDCEITENLLNASAWAKDLKDINRIRLMKNNGGCLVLDQDEPVCQSVHQDSIDPLFKAINTLRSRGDCGFSKVHAVHPGESVGQERVDCPNVISPTLKRLGIGSSYRINLKYYDSYSNPSGNTGITLRAGSTAESIIEQIESTNSFARSCDNAAKLTCKPEKKGSVGELLLARVNDAYRSIQVDGKREKCDLTGAEVGFGDGSLFNKPGKIVEAPYGHVNKTSCNVKMDLDLHMRLKNKEKNDIDGYAVNIKLYKGGHAYVINRTLGDIFSSVITKGDLSLSMDKEFQKFCKSPPSAIKRTRGSGIAGEQVFTGQAEVLAVFDDIPGYRENIEKINSYYSIDGSRPLNLSPDIAKGLVKYMEYVGATDEKLTLSAENDFGKIKIGNIDNKIKKKGLREIWGKGGLSGDNGYGNRGNRWRTKGVFIYPKTEDRLKIVENRSPGVKLSTRERSQIFKWMDAQKAARRDSISKFEKDEQGRLLILLKKSVWGFTGRGGTSFEVNQGLEGKLNADILEAKKESSDSSYKWFRVHPRKSDN